MDRYYQNTSNNAPGFIYFSQNPQSEYSNKEDTGDFLAFSDSPQASPQPNKFKPAYYSSPQSKFFRKSPRNYPPHNRKYQRWSGNHSYNSSNNSSYNQSTSLKEGEQESDISRFIHPSFLEDPWTHLEAKLKQQTQNNETNQLSQSDTTDT